jgi:hypothetical protein
MKSSLNVKDSSENNATLSPLSYPPSINFEHQNEKPKSKEASRA